MSFLIQKDVRMRSYFSPSKIEFPGLPTTPGHRGEIKLLERKKSGGASHTLHVIRAYQFFGSPGLHRT